MSDTITRQTDIEVAEIENRMKILGDARGALEAELQRAEAKLAAVRDQHAEKLKAAAARVQSLEAELISLVHRVPHLFKKPQSLEINGVRTGWRKGKGRLELPDTDKLIKRIGEVLTRAQQQAVVKVKVTVLRGQLARLPGEILKKLGVNLTAAGQEPFISYPKSDLEKQVDWWLKPIAAPAAGDDE